MGRYSTSGAGTGSGPIAQQDTKAAVRAASTENIVALSGLLVVDGVTLVAADRVLVKDQSTASENGIYAAAAGAWTRTTDADVDAEVTSGLSVKVVAGAENAATEWILVTADPITVGVTGLTFEKLGGPLPARTTAALDLYVSGDNGSDSADGLTPATALASLVEAESRIPDVVDHVVTVHFGASATPYTMPSFRERTMRRDIYVLGDGAGQAGEDGYTAIAGTGSSGAGGAGSSTTALEFAAGGMTPDAFRGKWIEIASGAAKSLRLIATNDATTFTPVRPFPASPSGATYRVVEPAAVFTMPDGEHILVGGGKTAGMHGQAIASGGVGTPAHTFQNMKLDASGAASFAVSLFCQGPTNLFCIDSSLSTKRIQVSFHGGSVGSTASVNFEVPSLNLVNDGVIGALAEWDGNGWGAELTDSFVELTNVTDVYETLDGSSLALTAVGHVFAIGDGTITGGDFRRTVASANSPLLLSGRCAVIGPSSSLKIKVVAVSVGVTVGARTAAHYQQQSAALRFVDVDCTGAGSGLGVLIDGAVAMQGGHDVSSDDIGIHLRRGACIFPIAPVVSGTTADLSFDGSTGFPSGDLAAAGDIVDNGAGAFQRV